MKMRNRAAVELPLAAAAALAVSAPANPKPSFVVVQNPTISLADDVAARHAVYFSNPAAVAALIERAASAKSTAAPAN